MMEQKIFHKLFIILSCFCYIKTLDAKIYERCELVRELKSEHGLSNHEAAMFSCIAEKQSNLDTNALGSSWGAQFHGIFQLSDEYWCSSTTTSSKGWVCGVTCDKFRDDDISDDFTCARNSIFAEHQRLSGDGFNAWPSNSYCKNNIYEYLSCLNGETNNFIGPQSLNQRPTKTTAKPNWSWSGNVNNNINNQRQVKQSNGKVYNNCELARELHYNYDISMDHVPTWVCIAYHESRYNTSAVGRLNWDGSGDHGLFQISDLYWCGPGKACGLSCDDLTNDDISDDVQCIKRIHAEHTRLSGDGFTAWAVYPRCRGDVSSYIRGCFTDDDSDNNIIPIRPRPAVTSPPKPQYKKKSNIGSGKVYSKCELAQELHYKHKIPMSQVPTWVCIAKQESGFNTSAIGRLNWDGSEDHGLFQISDIYWCTHGSSGKACNLACEDLRDNDITDDVKCIKQIHEEHTRLSGDGFNAWTVYPRCRGDVSSYVNGCFSDDDSDNNIVPQEPIRPRPAVTSPPKPQYKKKSNTGTGKVYSKCELAQELHYKHKIPLSQIPTWVCIAKHESGFNTSAIGRLNWDGSEDHGLFQISDIYWCTHGSSGKACNLACEDLRDNDITDDVKCIKQIHEEHTRLSGDGFNAWTVYPRCRGDLTSYVDKCFNEDKTTVKPVKPRPAVTAPPKPQFNVRREKSTASTTTKKTTRRPTTTTTTTKRPSTTTTRRPTTTSKKNIKAEYQSKPVTSWNTGNKIQTTTKKTLYNYYLNDFGKTSKSLPTFKPFSTFKSWNSWNQISSNGKKSVSEQKPKAQLLTTKSSNWNWNWNQNTKTSSSSSPTTTTTKKPTKNVPYNQTGTKNNNQNSWYTDKNKNDIKYEIQETAESDNKPKNAYEYYMKYVFRDAPVVATHPHMLGAAPEYTNLIDGFEPDFRKHQILIDVEPHTGIPLRGGKRVQFNMFLRKVDSIALTKNLRTTLFPIVWVDEGIELNDKMVDLVNSSLINVLFYLDLFQWGSVGIGIVMLIGCTAWFFIKKKKVRSQSVEPIFTIK
uniref:lysozyme n=1 Tax=Culicoides sonorensis TaxID=179676 RepID=A0A336LPC4_CULSO